MDSELKRKLERRRLKNRRTPSNIFSLKKETKDYEEAKTEQGKIDFLAKLQKRTKNRKKAKYISKNRNVIKQLLRDINSRPKFGKMISYSITCLTNLCVNEVSCEELADSGVFETIEKVAKLNPHNEHLRRLINTFMVSCGINDHVIRLINEKNVAPSLVQSLKIHLETRTLVSTCDTIEHLLNKKMADNLVKSNIQVALAKVMQRNNTEQADAKSSAKKGDVAASVARVTNKLLRSNPKHANLLLNSGVMAGLLSAMRIHPENEILLLKASEVIAILSKMDPDWAVQLKEMGAVRVLVKCLEKNPYNAELLRIGASALKRLGTTQELQKALKMLKELDPNAMATVGALALVGANVDYLIKNGGVPLITSVIKQIVDIAPANASKKEIRFMINGIHALERMANDEANVFEIIKNQGVQILMNAISRHSDKPDVVGAALAALKVLATRKENCDYLLKMGALKTAFAMVHRHKTDKIVAIKSLELYRSLCKTEELAARVLKMGALDSTLMLLSAQSKDQEIVLNALEFINVALAQAPGLCLSQMASNETFSYLLKALSDNKEDTAIVSAVLTLIHTSGSLDEPCLKILKASNALDCVLAILKIHKKDKSICSLAAKVAGLLATEEDIKIYLKECSDLNERVAMMDLTALVELVPLAGLIAGLAAAEENCVFLIKNNAISTLAKSIEAMKALPISPETNEALNSIAFALSELVVDENVAQQIVKFGIHKMLAEMALARKDVRFAEIASEIFKKVAEYTGNDEADVVQADGSLESITQLTMIYDENDIIVGNIQSAVQVFTAKGTTETKEEDMNAVVELTLSALENSEDVDKTNENLEFLVKFANDGKENLQILLANNSHETMMSLLAEYGTTDVKIIKNCIALLSKLAEEDDDLLIAYAQGDMVETALHSMRKLFNVPEVVKEEVVFLSKIADKDISYFVQGGSSVAKLLAWAAKAYANKEPQLVESAIFILKKLQIKAEEKARALREKEAKEKMNLEIEEEKKRQKEGKQLSSMEMDMFLHSIDINNPDMEVLGEMIAMIANRDNLSLFVESGGLDMMTEILLDPNVTDEAFNNAVLCFDASLVDMDMKSINLKADRKALDALLQIFAPDRVQKYDFGVDRLENSMGMLLEVSGTKDVLIDLLNGHDLGDALLKIVGVGSEPSMLVPTMKMLARISNLKEEAKRLANEANIKALIKAMVENMDKPDFLKFAAHLLGNLALNQHLQNKIGELGGVQAVVEAIKRYSEIEDLIDKTCYCLRMLSNKNTVNGGLMVRYDTPQLVIEAINSHMEATTRFFLNTIGTLLNLTKISSKYAEVIVHFEGDIAVISTMYTNMDQDLILKFCLQTLLKLIQPKTAALLLDHSVIHAINPCLDREDAKEEVIITGIRVFQRLARYAAKEKDLMGVIIAENAHKSIVSAISKYGDNASIMVPALDCLTVFARDPFTSNTIVRMGIIDTITDGLSALSYDEHFCVSAISLVEKLSQNTANLSIIANSQVIREMSECLDTYPTTLSFLSKYMITSARVCAQPQFAVKVAYWVIPRVVKATIENIEDVTALKHCFTCMVSLTQSPKTAEALAKKACEVSKMVIKSHYKDIPFLLTVLKFLSSLFLQMRAAEEGLTNTAILTTLLKRLARSPDELVTHRFLDVLYNAAISTNRTKNYMKDQNAITSLKECKQRWNAFPAICSNVDKVIQAILTPKIDIGDIGKMLVRPTDMYVPSARDTFGDNKNQKEEKYLIPHKYRNFLTSGQVLKWHEGKRSVHDRHVNVRHDLKRLMWSHPSDVNTKQSMGVWKIRRVKAGLCTEILRSKKKGAWKTKAPLENRALAVFGEDYCLNLEAPSEGLRDKWCRALDALLKHHKAHHHYATDQLMGPPS